MSSFLTFCRAAAQKQHIVYSGAKHSPPTSVLEGPSGWNRQFAKICKFSMFLGNLYEICLRHGENLKDALFLYYHIMFLSSKLKNLDHARGGVLTTPLPHEKFDIFRIFENDEFRPQGTESSLQMSSFFTFGCAAAQKQHIAPLGPREARKALAPRVVFPSCVLVFIISYCFVPHLCLFPILFKKRNRANGLTTNGIHFVFFAQHAGMFPWTAPS